MINVRIVLAFVLVTFVVAPVWAQGVATMQQLETQDAGPRQDPTIFGVGENIGLSQLPRGTRTFFVKVTDEALNKLICDFCYVGPLRRLITRSMSLLEIDDPVDISCARVPGQYPNLPQWKENPIWTLLCQFGARGVSADGLRHYGAGIQFAGFEDGRIAICLSTAPGVEGNTRYSGRNDQGQHLVCHFAIYPDGTVFLLYNTDNTDPLNPPRVYINGDVYISGRILPFSGDAHTHYMRDMRRETLSQENESRLGMRRLLEPVP